MKKLLRLCVVALLLAPIGAANATATKATAVAVTCAADGSSTEALAAAASRESYLITNTSGGTIRIGFLATGTADLTDSNSILLLAGQTFQDSAPAVFVGRVVCMNNTAGTATVYVIETRRP